jgi:hypothetical protein
MRESAPGIQNSEDKIKEIHFFLNNEHAGKFNNYWLMATGY